MNAHVQPPSPRPPVVAPRIVGVIQALVDAGGPFPAQSLATQLGMRVGLVSGVVSLARHALKPHGGAIVAAGTGPALTYRIESAETDIVNRVRGIAPALIRTDANDVDTPAPTAAPPGPASRSMPIGITLPPCGYTAWSFRPATGFRGPSHVVVHAGETCTRILTELDASSGLNTEKAPVAILDVEDPA